MKVARKVCILGVGMTKFHKPGQHDYPELAKEAGEQALQDAKISFSQIQQAYVGYVYGDSTCGQRVIYQFGETGIPVFNVNNNCATGSTALALAYQAVGSGMSECVLALGFEKMEKGALGVKFGDRTNPIDRHFNVMVEKQGIVEAPPTAQMFGGAGREHMERYGTTKEQFAKVALKNKRHGVKNERAQFRKELTLDDVMNSPTIFDPLTKLQCCPTTDGAAAAIVCSEEFAKKMGQETPVSLAGLSLKTDFPSAFSPPSMIKMIGQDMAAAAAKEVFEETGVSPKDVDVIELHDCFSTNELLSYENLQLCKEGEGGKLIDEGAVTYGGSWVVNPSGGLLSKGHPLGATGLAQCFELVEQLRGNCGERQVEGARFGLQHNLGLGGACVVALYQSSS